VVPPAAALYVVTASIGDMNITHSVVGSFILMKRRTILQKAREKSTPVDIAKGIGRGQHG